ncbi:MAG: hypothetical protein ACTSSE_13280 [Candidatus Thorarchaeota archaeon]
MSWKPLVVIEITSKGAETFRKYIAKLKGLLAEIPDKLLHEK